MGTHFLLILHPATTHPNYSLILHKQHQKIIYKPHSASPLSYILIVKLWLYLQAIPREQEHRQASECCWAFSQKYVPQILLFGDVIWIKWTPFPGAIILFASKCCVQREKLHSKRLLPWMRNHTNVCLALQLKCWDREYSKMQGPYLKRLRGVGFIHSCALISDWSWWRQAGVSRLTGTLKLRS